MAAGPEKRLVSRIVAAIAEEYPQAWVMKVHGSPYQAAGTPDLLVVVDGHLVALEVKAQRAGESEEAMLRRVTPLQRAMIDRLRDAGATAEVVWGVDQSLTVLRRYYPK